RVVHDGVGVHLRLSRRDRPVPVEGSALWAGRTVGVAQPGAPDTALDPQLTGLDTVPEVGVVAVDRRAEHDRGGAVRLGFARGGHRTTRGMPRPCRATSSRWISLVPPPKV